jgi:hypothetical protein
MRSAHARVCVGGVTERGGRGRAMPSFSILVNLLEPEVIGTPLATPRDLDKRHNDLRAQRRHVPGVQRSSAARTVSSNTSSSNGFPWNCTAPDRNAFILLRFARGPAALVAPAFALNPEPPALRSFVMAAQGRVRQRHDSRVGTRPLTGISGSGPIWAWYGSTACARSRGRPRPVSNCRALSSSWLLAGRDGTLWIGTFSGFVSWRNRQLTHHPEIASHQGSARLEDSSGTVWVGTSSQPVAKLCAFRGGRAICFREDGTLSDFVSSPAEDGARSMWVAACTGLWRWTSSTAQFESAGRSGHSSSKRRTIF